MTRLLLLLAVLLPALAVAQEAAPPARYVATGGVVYTVDDDRPTAEAFVVEDGRFVAVGSEAEVRAAYPDWPRLDLGGAAVVPGLIDAHAHLLGLGTSLLQADLVGATSRAEVVERLQAFAADLPDGAWVTGRGWDQNDWGEGEPFPTRADLDAAFPDRPVWLGRIDGHASWANTAALRAAGIDPEAPAPSDPEGGAVVRDEAGRPTGVFVDAAEALVARALPAPDAAVAEEALRRALEETTRYGLTGVHEAGVPIESLDLYRRAIDAGRFPIRNYAMLSQDELGAFCERYPDGLEHGGRLVARSLKVYADGALGSRGAALLADYADDPGNQGLLFHPDAALRQTVEDAMRCGLQVNTHAIGDRANRQVLDAYQTALAATGGADGGAGRHRIEHAQVLSLDDLERFAALGVIASVQPTHATSDMPWVETRVGGDRARGAYAWRRLVDSGARLALGSDFPVERVDPLLGFHAAVTRQDAADAPAGGWYGNQTLTRAEALRGFTLDAAYAAFMEDEVGSIEPGKRADFVLLSRDIMTAPPEAILDARVLATYLDGAPVYQAD
ncbi:amidohydrolase [Rubrivirga sp. S365]|uniref:amidohydrolase n=1 Tax=Rubrivirga sp. S365 TaxID=3076080 RepID=UPI0028CAAB52|nr:amidohydrolase [Rubrivirga sp. S365]MDT7856318.1 amidohydrolase [Rubrivirga sp. S365]